MSFLSAYEKDPFHPSYRVTGENPPDFVGGVRLCGGRSLLTQWLVYDDWLHRKGPLRIVGTCIAAILTFLFALRWQMAIRERQLEMVRRLEMILRMNDRIRNALQAIECLTYVAQPEATEAVRQSVNMIDNVLREVLAESRQAHEPARAEAAVPSIQSKSA